MNESINVGLWRIDSSGHLARMYLTLSQTTNFRLSKLKEFADDNFKFVENGRKTSKQVENTVGKGEIARYEQFLLFPTVCSTEMYCRHVKTRACLRKA